MLLLSLTTDGGPALAQYFNGGLGFLDGRDEPARIEYTAPSGVSCRFNAGPRPTIAAGAGVIGGIVLPGVYGSGNSYASSVADPQPIVGLALRVPLGRSIGTNCDRIIEADRRAANLTTAETLYEKGLIDKAQLQAIADQLYSELRR